VEPDGLLRRGNACSREGLPDPRGLFTTKNLGHVRAGAADGGDVRTLRIRYANTQGIELRPYDRVVPGSGGLHAAPSPLLHPDGRDESW
jgi:hypothetical protein